MTARTAIALAAPALAVLAGAALAQITVELEHDTPPATEQWRLLSPEGLHAGTTSDPNKPAPRAIEGVTLIAEPEPEPTGSLRDTQAPPDHAAQSARGVTIVEEAEPTPAHAPTPGQEGRTQAPVRPEPPAAQRKAGTSEPPAGGVAEGRQPTPDTKTNTQVTEAPEPAAEGLSTGTTATSQTAGNRRPEGPASANPAPRGERPTQAPPSSLVVYELDPQCASITPIRIATDATPSQWCARSGETLADTARRWASEAHWQIEYASRYHWPISHAVLYEGEFLDALGSLATALARASPAPIVHAHDGNQVIVIRDNAQERGL